MPTARLARSTTALANLRQLPENLDGGTAQNLSYSYVADLTTVDAMSGPDFSSTYGLGYSVELNAAITSGSVAAFVDLTQTVQIFEADGVTSVSLVSATLLGAADPSRVIRSLFRT
jgi:hypothetical protein